MKKYAMMFMNPLFEPSKQNARLDLEQIEHHMITVRDEQEAIEKAKELADHGFGVIEVCGAFGEELARKMYEETGHRLVVGYVTYPVDQEEALERFWNSI